MTGYLQRLASQVSGASHRPLRVAPLERDVEIAAPQPMAVADANTRVASSPARPRGTPSDIERTSIDAVDDTMVRADRGEAERRLTSRRPVSAAEPQRGRFSDRSLTPRDTRVDAAPDLEETHAREPRAGSASSGTLAGTPRTSNPNPAADHRDAARAPVAKTSDVELVVARTARTESATSLANSDRPDRESRKLATAEREIEVRRAVSHTTPRVELQVGTITLEVHAPPPAANVQPATAAPARAPSVPAPSASPSPASRFSPNRHYIRRS